MEHTKQYAINRARLEACSTHEGILISSSAFSDMQTLCAYVKRNPDGTIEKSFINQSLIAEYTDYKEKNPEEYYFVSKATMIFQHLISFIMAIVAFSGSKTLSLFIIFLWCIMYIIGSLRNISYCIALALYHLKVPSLSRYHGAEHMAIKAYDKYKRIPSIPEMLQENKYDCACSSIETSLEPTMVSIVNTIVLAATIFPFANFILQNMSTLKCIQDQISLVLLSILFICYLQIALSHIPQLVARGFKSGFLTRLTQWIVVKTPSLAELEVAQTALKLRDMLDEMIKNDPEGFEIKTINFNIIDKKAIYTYQNNREVKITLNEYINYIISIRDAIEINLEDVEPDDERDILFIDEESDAT